jgi:hypothetical protein
MPTSAHNALASAAGLASPSIGDGDSCQLAAIDRARDVVAPAPRCVKPAIEIVDKRALCAGDVAAERIAAGISTWRNQFHSPEAR